jgi:hypothetical protein
MKGQKRKQIKVEGSLITVEKINNDDFISLTDMVNGFEGQGALIERWLRNRNTLEFLGVWETLYNEDFNSLEFEGIKKEAGLNQFFMSVKQWVQRTKSKGLAATAGRYGGTFAHKDIAFEFGSWLSPKFKLFLIKEFQRLKEEETKTNDIEWNVKRVLSKANYKIHTDAIKEHMIPKLSINKDQEWIVYANEADLLNVALFGCTSKQWKEQNQSLALSGSNVRDFATIDQLTVLSNMENINSIMVKQGVDRKTRFGFLQNLAKEQLKSLGSVNLSEKLLSAQIPHETYLDAENVYTDEKKNKK